MFNTGSRLTITKSVVESDVSGLELADSVVESADSTTDSAADPVKISLWVQALTRYTIQVGPICPMGD